MTKDFDCPQCDRTFIVENVDPWNPDQVQCPFCEKWWVADSEYLGTDCGVYLSLTGEEAEPYKPSSQWDLYTGIGVPEE